ncbi:MAG TPA: ABC transporter substrate-binding protein [Solirubrobacterales bacterium]
MLTAVGALLAGCGSGDGAETHTEKPTPIHIALDGLDGPANVGILLAQKLGYFQEAGLEATITSPIGPRRPVLYVVEGSVDLSVSHLPQIALARELGAPIVAVASVIPDPTAAMLWLQNSKIENLADLEGKTIGIPGIPFQRDFLASSLEGAGLTLDDVEVKSVEYELVPALVSGRVDAIFGGEWNLEGAELQARGLRPVITKAQSLGIPDYEELALIARPDRLAGDPQSIRGFIAATLRGTEAAIEDPEAAIAAIEGSVGEHPPLGREEIEAELEATLPLLSTDGEMSPNRASQMLDWMQEEGMLSNPAPASSLLSNDYLP